MALPLPASVPKNAPHSSHLRPRRRRSSSPRNRSVRIRSLRRRLLKQLQALRDLVPHSNLTGTACVIRDALEYSEVLKKQMRLVACRNDTLHEFKETSHCGPETLLQLEVIQKNCGVFVLYLSFERKPLMLPVIMSQIEDVGLDYHEVNISCQGTRTCISAFGRERHGQSLQIDEVTEMLMQKLNGNCRCTLCWH